MWSVELAHAADLAGFRAGVRAALALAVDPADIDWRVAGAPGLPLGAPLPMPADPPAPRVPRRFVELAELAVCNRYPDRFRLLHRLLVRLQGAPGLLEDRADPEVDAVAELAKAVSRDRHKMRAFLRFREVQEEEGPHFIAWFEPDHHVLRLDVGFFIRRFASQRWTILTPDVSAHWDGEALHWMAGAEKADAPADDPVEAVWKTYYAHIFNPARLKVKAMQAEMPKKYWKNLPEAELIPELIAGAEARMTGMIERGDRDARGAADLFGGAGAGGRPTPGPSLEARGDLAALAAAAKACTRCPLHAPATQTVFGEGPADARLMIVGEQPGDQEDLAGRPFVGPAGQLLDACLAEAGIDRSRAYVTNAVKHFNMSCAASGASTAPRMRGRSRPAAGG